MENSQSNEASEAAVARKNEILMKAQERVQNGSNTIPQQLEDRNRSEWTKAFYSIHAATGSRGDSLVLPMIIKARKS